MNIFNKNSKLKILMLVILCLPLIFSFNNEGTKGYTKISSVVVYYGGDSYLNTYYNLQQSDIIGLKVDKMDLKSGAPIDLSKYNYIYLDDSVLNYPDFDSLVQNVITNADQGAGVFLTASVAEKFPKDFRGFEKVDRGEFDYDNIEYPTVGEDLTKIQTTLKDFVALYSNYKEFDPKSKNVSEVMTGVNGTSLANIGDSSILLVNKYGVGQVLVTTSFFPNYETLDRFDVNTDPDKVFVESTTYLNSEIKNQFASYISKQKNGYTLERVLGANGRPSASWQLHYEEIDAVKDNAMDLFIDEAKELVQVPSASIIRANFDWFARKESVTYMTGISDGQFDQELYENVYSTGKHATSEGNYINFATIDDRSSYFVDVPHAEQSSIGLVDQNKDGYLDMYAASSNGNIMYYENDQSNDFSMKEGVKIKTAEGEVITVPTPAKLIYIQVGDFDSDGQNDILVSNGSNSIHFYKGLSDVNFEPHYFKIKFASNIKVVSFDVTDLNDDGLIDIVLCDETGKLYYGLSSGELSFTSLQLISNIENYTNEGRIAINLHDIDNDGDADIVFGNADGYIGKIIQKSHSLKFDGYYEGEYTNYKNNKKLKFGTNAAPVLADITGDGILDLVVTHIELGMAVSADSEHFPYEENLRHVITSLNEMGGSTIVHFFTHEYAEEELEQKELEFQKNMFEYYGIDFKKSGVNQHTWYTSTNDNNQSFRVQFENGLLWNSGQTMANRVTSPQVGTENTLVMPFFMVLDGETTEFLIFNTTSLMYLRDYKDIAGYNELPISLYYHVEGDYTVPELMKEKMAFIDEYVTEFNYGFVSETQMVNLIRLAHDLDVNVTKTKNDVYEIERVIAPNSLYTGYNNAAGLRVSLSEKYKDRSFITNSKVYYNRGLDHYIALDSKTYFDISKNIEKDTRENTKIRNINLPARVTQEGNKYTVKFDVDGLQCIKVDATDVTIDNPDFKTRTVGDETWIYKYGQKGSVVFEVQ